MTGIGRDSRLRRIVDHTGRDIPAPLSGLVLSRALADALDVSPGQRVTLEVLEGDRPRRDVVVSRLVDDVFGVGAYMDMTRSTP